MEISQEGLVNCQTTRQSKLQAKFAFGGVDLEVDLRAGDL
jgi:hypothetical protein